MFEKEVKNEIDNKEFENIFVGLPSKYCIDSNRNLYFEPCLLSDYAAYSGRAARLSTTIGEIGAWMTSETWCYGTSWDYPECVYIYVPTISAGLNKEWIEESSSYCGIRPVLYIKGFDFSKYAKRNSEGKLEVEFGEYPQKRVDSNLEKILNSTKLKETGKKFRIDANDAYSDWGYRVSYDVTEYEYQGKKYVHRGTAWFEVEPVKWLVNENHNELVCKNVIVSDTTYQKWRLKFGSIFQQDLLLSADQYIKIKENEEILRNITNKLRKGSSKEKAKILSLLDPHTLDFISYNNKMSFLYSFEDVDIKHIKEVRDFFYDVDEDYGKEFDSRWISSGGGTSEKEKEKKRKKIEELKQEKAKEGFTFIKKK